jgi:tRNA G18 (ribose-2'-O)-methylase SpoU
VTNGPAIEDITDPTDPRLADFRDLKTADSLGRSALVIAEGVNVVERLLRSDYRPRSIAGVPAKLDALAPTLARFGRDVEVLRTDKWTLSDVAGFRVTRGVLASAHRPAPRDAAELIGRARHLLVLETVNDFENLGALFRNAAAFGLDGVLLDPRCADPLYRRSVRVSMGHVFAMPFAVLPDPWPAALELLHESGLATIALTPGPDSRPLRELPIPDRWAVLLGAEGPGLSAGALAAARHRVRIPMAAGVDSLNVATAAAVATGYLTASA